MLVMGVGFSFLVLGPEPFPGTRLTMVVASTRDSLRSELADTPPGVSGRSPNAPEGCCASVKCLYVVVRSFDPTGSGQQR